MVRNGSMGRKYLVSFGAISRSPSLWLLCCLCTCTLVSAGRIHRNDESQQSYLELLLTKRSSVVPSRSRQCPIYRNEALYSIVDRICELCFEMFRHQDPNLRVKCRSRCFQNEQFTSCVSILNPSLELGVVPMRRRPN